MIAYKILSYFKHTLNIPVQTTMLKDPAFMQFVAELYSHYGLCTTLLLQRPPMQFAAAIRFWFDTVHTSILLRDEHAKKLWVARLQWYIAQYDIVNGKKYLFPTLIKNCHQTLSDSDKEHLFAITSLQVHQLKETFNFECSTYNAHGYIASFLEYCDAMAYDKSTWLRWYKEFNDILHIIGRDLTTKYFTRVPNCNPVGYDFYNYHVNELYETLSNLLYSTYWGHFEWIGIFDAKTHISTAVEYIQYKYEYSDIKPPDLLDNLLLNESEASSSENDILRVLKFAVLCAKISQEEALTHLRNTPDINYLFGSRGWWLMYSIATLPEDVLIGTTDDWAIPAKQVYQMFLAEQPEHLIEAEKLVHVISQDNRDIPIENNYQHAFLIEYARNKHEKSLHGLIGCGLQYFEYMREYRIMEIADVDSSIFLT